MRITFAAASLLLAAPAFAQLTPDRTYYGIGREIPMTVKTPADSKGEVVIQLLEAGSAKVFASAPAAAGGVNMATLFPQFWSDKPNKVLYAQLVVGETKIGPAVVIEPLAHPARAYADPNGGPIQFSPGGQGYSGVRAYTDKHVVLETTMGDIEIELRPDAAPNTVWNFRDLVAGGFYTDIKFHRIAAVAGNGKPFVVQAGDPTGVGNGGCGRSIALEPSTLPHDFGVLSMARSSDPNTGGSQFFLCLSREGTAFLDNNYTSFGVTLSGGKSILDIAAVPTDRDKPRDPAPKIKSAKLIDAPPYGTGPKQQTREQAEGKAPEPKPADPKPEAKPDAKPEVKPGGKP